MSHIYLFCYGSNSARQIQERLSLSLPLEYKNAMIPDYCRIFAGKSSRWGGGGIATIIPCKGRNVYGIVVKCTFEQLMIIDTYEIGYRLEMMDVIVDESARESHTSKNCFVYMKENTEFRAFPSIDYLSAIDEMLSDRISAKKTRRIMIRALCNGKVVTKGYFEKGYGIKNES